MTGSEGMEVARSLMIDSDSEKMREACLAEAEMGLAAGAALAAVGQYGRARSMDLLAYETAVQAVACHWVFMGWATLTRANAGERFYISPAALGNHPLKQLLIAFVDPTVRAFARDVVDHEARGEPTGLGPPEAVDEMRQEVSEAPLPLGELNRMKNAGLYPILDSGEIRTPSMVSKRDYDTIHRRLARRIKLIKALVRSNLTPEEAARSGRWARVLAREGRALDEPLLNRIREAEKKTGQSPAELLALEFEGRGLTHHDSH